LQGFSQASDEPLGSRLVTEQAIETTALRVVYMTVIAHGYEFALNQVLLMLLT
jgi:hypothetical protein